MKKTKPLTKDEARKLFVQAGFKEITAGNH
jgi:hypothetical protein